MNGFQEISPEFLKTIATNDDATPTLYHSPSGLVRKVFWFRLRLIHRLLQRHAVRRQSCLDFCGGGGVLSPTLCAAFQRVVLIDLETREAAAVAAHFGLSNLSIICADVNEADIGAERFDAIVAADALEHFRELDKPIRNVKNWLTQGGVLVTSLPTENWIYRVLRRVFNVTAPQDHYHTGYEVEARLRANGFLPVGRYHIPLMLPVLPLFLVTAWRCSQPA